MQCDYFDAGLCRSCTLMGQPYADQLAAKDVRARGLLADHAGIEWLPPVASAESGFRAKAKMVVGGTVDAPTLGILDGRGRGVDLRECGIISPAILAAFPALIDAITTVGLTPYDVPARRGELKNLIVTAAPSGQLMVRFVVASAGSVPRIRTVLPQLQKRLPQLTVVTANLHPTHSAVLEGDEEVVLTERDALPFTVGDVELQVRPRGFVQTNTAIAAALYAQAAQWVHERAPRTVWDLYCGVGGFALHAAIPDARGGTAPPRVLGVETSADAVASARLSAERAGLDHAEFLVGDATEYAVSASASPDLVIVNPPRRGLGERLATWLDGCGASTVIYSSCNVESLARDLDAMPSWRVRRARVLDMFPQSTHMEVITLLTRNARPAS